MSAASVQLVRLISFKTVPKRTSSGASSTSEPSTSALRPSLLGSRRRASSAAQDRFSASSSGSRGGGQGAGKNVGIEVFAHGASGKEAVLVAFLSNSVLLVLRMGAEGLRSWLLEWPVAGKIRGLCVSPDLQCILCVTEGLEGVYLLAIDNLGDQDEAMPHPTEAVPSLDDGAATTSGLHAGGGGEGDTSDGKREKNGSGAKQSPAATTARHAPKRTVADTAFPSLVHLASRGEQRKRAGSAKARHPLAEPVFIASLARRGAGGGGESKGQGRQESDDDRGTSRRHSTGSSGRGPRQRGGGGRVSAAPFECLWWVTRDGDHFAIIGGPGGEVHFLDLERLGAWVVTPPPPAMARGRVCALSIVADLAGTPQRPPPAQAGSDSAPPPPASEALDKTATALSGNEQSHLVAVLETGAVFVVLLERFSSDGGGASSGGEGGSGRSEDGAESEATDKSSKNDKRGGDDGNSSKGGGGEGQDSSREYIRLGADPAARPEFAPSWLDVGRGGGGGGGGGMGVRAIPPLTPRGRGGDASSGRLRMSIVSRAWGNKCAVKILRVAGTPGAAVGGGAGDKEKEPQQGWGRDWGNLTSGSGRQQAFRTETVRQVTLPVDHPVPEQHALAAVDGSYAVLASPPAGGAPARVTVAPLGGSERPAAHPVCVFPLPAGEHVRGVVLLPCGGASSGADGDGKAAGSAARSAASWGLVWSEFCVYRVDLGVNARGAAGPKAATGTAGHGSATPKARLPSTPARQSRAKASGSIALRRPPAAAVRRAHELHAAGEVSEATQVAMEALDGAQASPAAPSRGAGGEATTRMVREELANSLLEWLVALHVRQTSAGIRLATTGCLPREEGPGAADAAGSIDGGSSHVCNEVPVSDKAKARRYSTWSSAAGGLHGRPARRGSKLTPPSRLAPKSGPKNREPALATPTKTPPNKTPAVAAAASAAAAAASLSQLERYLLSSRDYDPLLAATLLHDHGEADLAIVAGTVRGEKGAREDAVAVLPKVLRVLAESAWPPRLGPRAVDALCGDKTGVAAREAVHASGGMLFAALEPGLQLRVLLSHKSVVIGRAEAGESAAGEEELGAAAEVGAAAISAKTGAGGAVAGVRRLLGPIVPDLSTEELNVLVSRLAEWCKEDATGRRPEGEHGGDATADEESPPVAALEALEVLLQALCELAKRTPPAGEHHRLAWSHAGCIIDEPESHERRVSGTPPLEWAQLTTSLCDVLTGEGAALGASESGEDAGGLPAAARRQLLRVLPVVCGWHEPVGVLLRLREAGCWAAVALQLELSGNGREAAAATLHGVVAHLRGRERGSQGETSRILSGRALPTDFSAREPSSSPGTTAAAADVKRTASEAVLRVLNTHAFPTGRGEGAPEGSADGVETTASSPAAALPPAAPPRAPAAASTSAVVLERASVLSEALCVWKYFGLPLPELEACLRPQLEDGDGARVLTAVFFPQLSRDTARNGAPTRDPPGQGDRRRARGSGGAFEGKGARTTNDGAPLHDLGLSPRFFLALTRAAGKPAVPGSAASSSRYFAPNDGRSAVGSAATSSGSSQLTLLLEHQAGEGGGSELDSAWVRLGAASAPGSSPRAGRRGGRADVGSAWRPVPGTSGAHGYAPSYSSRAAAAADRHADTAVWFFSCGHRFSRQELLDSVVPASASSVRQATASLDRTQQVLALEYEGRSSAAAGAACPECAAKELVRLAAVAGSSMQARRASTGGGSSSPLPPPPPPQRLPTQERPRVR